jgi:hypothetical protein
MLRGHLRHTGEKQFKFELKTIKISIKIYPHSVAAQGVFYTQQHIMKLLVASTAASRHTQRNIFIGAQHSQATNYNFNIVLSLCFAAQRFDLFLINYLPKGVDEYIKLYVACFVCWYCFFP